MRGEKEGKKAKKERRLSNTKRLNKKEEGRDKTTYQTYVERVKQGKKEAGERQQEEKTRTNHRVYALVIAVYFSGYCTSWME